MTKKKKISLLVAFVVIVALSIWCATRWKVWFGQPEEAEYGVSEKPWRVMLTFGNDGELSRNINWQCDSVVRKSWVEYYTIKDTSNTDTTHEVKTIEAQGEVFRSRAGVACYYVARLKNLDENTRYKYRVLTDGRASDWYEFSTYADSERDFGFLFVGDVQDTTNGEFNNFLKMMLAKHSEAEFLACGGDLTDRPRDSDWAETFRGLDSVATAMPILTVTGNHDYLKEFPRRLERRFPLVFSYFLDSKIEDNMVYTMRYGSAQFFLLDSDRELPYLLTQKEWLENELEKSDAKWKIVLIHHPLYSMRGTNNMIQRWVFADLIEDSKVDLVLQGHEHNYGRMHTEGTTTPIYTVSHCSPKTYRHKDLSRFDVTHIDSRFYQYIRTSGDSLFMSAHEVYHDSLIDSVCIVKRDGKAEIVSGK